MAEKYSDWDYTDTSNQSECNHPFVSDWIFEYAGEQDGQNEVRESEPVCAVGNERIFQVSLGKPVVNADYPAGKSFEVRVALNPHDFD